MEGVNQHHLFCGAILTPLINAGGSQSISLSTTLEGISIEAHILLEIIFCISDPTIRWKPFCLRGESNRISSLFSEEIRTSTSDTKATYHHHLVFEREYLHFKLVLIILAYTGTLWRAMSGASIIVLDAYHISNHS